MSKTISLSLSDWVYDKYLLTTDKLNRSKYIEEMFVKGVDSDVQEWQGIHSKFSEATRIIRERDEKIANLQRELASVKSRVMTQEKRRAEKSAEIRKNAMSESMRRLEVARMEQRMRDESEQYRRTVNHKKEWEDDEKH